MRGTVERYVVGRRRRRGDRWRDRAGRPRRPGHVGLLDHGGQRLLRGAPRVEETREVSPQGTRSLPIAAQGNRTEIRLVPEYPCQSKRSISPGRLIHRHNLTRIGNARALPMGVRDRVGGPGGGLEPILQSWQIQAAWGYVFVDDEGRKFDWSAFFDGFKQRWEVGNGVETPAGHVGPPDYPKTRRSGNMSAEFAVPGITGYPWLRVVRRPVHLDFRRNLGTRRGDRSRLDGNRTIPGPKAGSPISGLWESYDDFETVSASHSEMETVKAGPRETVSEGGRRICVRPAATRRVDAAVAALQGRGRRRRGFRRGRQ